MPKINKSQDLEDMVSNYKLRNNQMQIKPKCGSVSF